jgi:hypothetical protein
MPLQTYLETRKEARKWPSLLDNTGRVTPSEPWCKPVVKFTTVQQLRPVTTIETGHKIMSFV